MSMHGARRQRPQRFDSERQVGMDIPVKNFSVPGSTGRSLRTWEPCCTMSRYLGTMWESQCRIIYFHISSWYFSRMLLPPWFIAEKRIFRRTNFLEKIIPISMTKTVSLVNPAPQLSGQVRREVGTLPPFRNLTSELTTQIMSQWGREDLMKYILTPSYP